MFVVFALPLRSIPIYFVEMAAIIRGPQDCGIWSATFNFQDKGREGW